MSGPSASALVNGVSTIKLVPFNSSDDDAEPVEPFQPQRASTPAASQSPLISLDSNSSAMFKLVRADTKASKDVCPSAVCKMKRANKRTWWVQCSEKKGMWTMVPPAVCWCDKEPSSNKRVSFYVLSAVFSKSITISSH